MMKLNIQMFGGRGATSGRNLIVVSGGNGTSKIVNKKTGKTIASGLSLSRATRDVNLVQSGKTNLKDLGYKEK